MGPTCGTLAAWAAVAGAISPGMASSPTTPNKYRYLRAELFKVTYLHTPVSPHLTTSPGSFCTFRVGLWSADKTLMVFKAWLLSLKSPHTGSWADKGFQTGIPRLTAPPSVQCPPVQGFYSHGRFQMHQQLGGPCAEPHRTSTGTKKSCSGVVREKKG